VAAAQVERGAAAVVLMCLNLPISPCSGQAWSDCWSGVAYGKRLLQRSKPKTLDALAAAAQRAEHGRYAQPT
jgi:hypothetical protein